MSIRKMAEARAKPHIDQANQALRLADHFALSNDKDRASFWQRVWKEKQQDAENVKDLVMRAYR